MKNLVLSLFALSMLSLALAGCNKAPDPTKNPDFKANTMKDPGAVKMGENGPKVNQQ
jgi:predicted small lipoprotein YifL